MCRYMPPLLAVIMRLTFVAIVRCPYTENSAFIGRITILKEIRQKLQHNGDDQANINPAAPQTRRTVALYGLGGVG
jgi:hypothetical protein